MFLVPQGSSYVSLTQNRARKTLHNIILNLGLDPKIYSFHTFRRSAASLAFQNNTSLEAIQAQGTWASQAVWTYLSNHPTQQNAVVTTFKNVFSK